MRDLITKRLTIDEFNNLLDVLEQTKKIDLRVGTMTVSFIINNEKKYITSLTGEIKDIANTGNIWKQFKSIVGEQNYDIRGQFGWNEYKISQFKTKVAWKPKNSQICDPGGYSYVDESRAGKSLQCFSYDINSAYSFAMTKPMPDILTYKGDGILEDGEIGFYNSGYATTTPGAWAQYVFKLKESPYIEYVNKYYKKKQEAKTKDERKNWKFFLNIPSGMLQRFNVWHRLAILYWAGEYIKQFIDDDTVYCNVDSIVSTKRRTDLPIGDELGKFKEDHVDQEFKYLQPGIYQWGQECHYKGIPGCTLTDIQNTENWEDNLPYKFNTETRRIEKNEQQ